MVYIICYNKNSGRLVVDYTQELWKNLHLLFKMPRKPKVSPKVNDYPPWEQGSGCALGVNCISFVALLHILVSSLLLLVGPGRYAEFSIQTHKFKSV